MKTDSKLLGIICIVLAQFFNSTQDMIIKFVSEDYALHQIMLTRSIVAILFTLFVFVPIDGGLKFLRSQQLGFQLLRGFVVVIANLCFFSALVTMPLAEVVTIFFIAPLLITALSEFLIGEKVSLTGWIAVLVGLIGMIIMLRPGFGLFNPVSILPLAAALAYSLVQIMTRKIGKNEKASTMAIYIQLNLFVVSSLMGLIFGNGHLADPSQPTINFLFRAWIMPLWGDWMIMFGIGLLNCFSAYFISQAYRISKAGVIAPFEYVALPLSIFWSITIFGDWPDIVSWLGIFIIAGSGLLIVYSETYQDEKKYSLPTNH